jgi:tripartite-type tricarboxylate transporter receptor subunit TctC
MTSLQRRAFVAAGAASLALPSFAQQLLSNNKPVRLVVAYPAGGVSDAVARAICDKLAARMAQTFIVDNKAGASGTIGVDAVAKAAPDGHTFGFTSTSPLAISPHLGKVPYDPPSQITPVVSVMYSPVVLLATPALAVRDFRELLALAKEKPRTLRWATSGSASLGHLMLEQLQEQAHVQMVHIPYKGGGQQMTDALGGQFEILSTNAGPAISAHIKAGKLRPLAVGAPKRLESLPNVPTLAELGYAKANLSSQFGIVGPGALPKAVVDKLNAEVNAVLQLPEIRSQLVSTGNVPTGGSAEAFAKQIAAESEANLRIIRAVGIKAD